MFYLLVAWCLDHGKPCKTWIHSDYRWNVAVYARSSLLPLINANVLNLILFRYDSCDVGTFPNQTDADGSGPAAALHSNASRALYNFELSWLPGQRTS